MINFENLDGFVVDMRTNDECNAILEDILCGDGVMCEIMQRAPLDTKRDFITSYFITTYKQVFIKHVNVLQVCEEELYNFDDVDFLQNTIKKQDNTITELRKLNEEGLEYATTRDNKIEELEDFIGKQAVELLRQEDQLETLTKELLMAQKTIDEIVDKNSTLKLANDEHSRNLSIAHNTIDMLTTKLEKIKEIINNER